jgi:rhodanese-related sulfurtransferase
MKKLLTALTTVALLVPAAVWACPGEHGTPVRTVNASQGGKLNKESKATFVDANSAETRTKYGVIPGAVLLTSYESYDASKELPAKKDQPLVFYCANERCGASMKAAERAAEAGYKDVAVLPEGIMGWKEAGLPVDLKAAIKVQPKAEAKGKAETRS